MVSGFVLSRQPRSGGVEAGRSGLGREVGAVLSLESRVETVLALESASERCPASESSS